MRRAVLDILEVLAADETERIREIVSDTLKDDPNVPPHVVQQLAADPQLTVCGPILEFSPVLMEEDLLELISSKPVQDALSAILNSDNSLDYPLSVEEMRWQLEFFKTGF